MIPAQNIVAWGNVVPWADQRQVEQDLIISRALVEIFSDAMLRDELRFRGGTALDPDRSHHSSSATEASYRSARRYRRLEPTSQPPGYAPNSLRASTDCISRRPSAIR
jgi:hypothetical protein